MKPQTWRALEAINETFYTGPETARFAATRSGPWGAWHQVVAQAPAGHLNVLDVGCGNGRFAAFLQRHVSRPFRYRGIDASEALIGWARREHAAPHIEFCRRDMWQGTPAEAGGFELIVAFGLMHHVPCFERRRALLARWVGGLAPGGLLAVSFWRFWESARLRARLVPWDEYNRARAHPIDLEDLEPGDHLLRWGEGSALRYCHMSGRDEIDRLVQEAGTPPGQERQYRYRVGYLHEPGEAGNDYLLLRRVGAVPD